MIQDLKLGFLMESNQQYVPAGLRINKARLPLPLLFQKTLSCVVPRLTKSRLSGDHNGTFEPNPFQIFEFHTVFGISYIHPQGWQELLKEANYKINLNLND